MKCSVWRRWTLGTTTWRGWTSPTWGIGRCSFHWALLVRGGTETKLGTTFSILTTILLSNISAKHWNKLRYRDQSDSNVYFFSFELGNRLRAFSIIPQDRDQVLLNESALHWNVPLTPVLLLQLVSEHHKLCVLLIKQFLKGPINEFQLLRQTFPVI